MTKEHEKIFEEELENQLKKARLQGIGIGAKSISKVIHDKTNVDFSKMSKNDVVRIVKDIKKFCETGLAIKENEIN